MFVLGCIAVAFAALSWLLLDRRLIDTRAWSLVAAVVVWGAGLGVKLSDGAANAPDADVQPSPLASLPIDSLAWPGDSQGAPRTPGNVEAPMEAAPIANLIGGLEARLVSNPEDAKGWALLAQSYAFVGKADAAEQALSRAVELGVDEQSLRERIAAAAQRVQHGDWIQQAIGG